MQVSWSHCKLDSRKWSSKQAWKIWKKKSLKIRIMWLLKCSDGAASCLRRCWLVKQLLELPKQVSNINITTSCAIWFCMFVCFCVLYFVSYNMSPSLFFMIYEIRLRSWSSINAWRVEKSLSLSWFPLSFFKYGVWARDIFTLFGLKRARVENWNLQIVTWIFN